MNTKTHTPAEISQIIAMAWDDDTSFEAITLATGLVEAEVKALMKRELKPGSYKTWRERVKGRSAKHGERHLDMMTKALKPLRLHAHDD